MSLAHVLLAISLSQAPAQTVSMSGTFVPAQPTGGGPFLFVLQLDSSAPLHGAQATIRPRPGFIATRPTLDVAEGARKTALVFELRAAAGAPTAGDLVASVTAAPGLPLNEGHYTFTYAPLVSLGAFYPLALAGILIGWLTKLLVKAAAGKTPPPAVANLFQSPRTLAQNVAAVRAGQTPAKSAFAAKLEGSAGIYYFADGVLTLVIGFLVLLALTKDGAAPAAASHWQGAMITGFGLGVLTPQDLLGKVK